MTRTELNLEVDIFAGASVEVACGDLVALADKLGIVVMAKANGVRLMAKPGGSAQALFKNWESARIPDLHSNSIATSDVKS